MNSENCNSIHSHRVPFLNTSFDNVTFDDVCRLVDYHVSTKVPASMVSINADIVVRLNNDPEFSEIFNNTDLILMDSQPLIKVARKKGIEVQEKLSGSDLLPRICEHAADKGYTCFILGGAEGVPEQAAKNLIETYPGLRFQGTYSPRYGFEKSLPEVDEIVSMISIAKPDILFICLGTPKSEKVFYPKLQELNVPFVFSVGAAVDFVAGNVKRAPTWMQEAGLEWLFRFFNEPKRLFKRYFIDSFQLLPLIWRS